LVAVVVMMRPTWLQCCFSAGGWRDIQGPKRSDRCCCSNEEGVLARWGRGAVCTLHACHPPPHCKPGSVCSPPFGLAAPVWHSGGGVGDGGGQVV